MASQALIDRAKSRVGAVLREKWRLDSLLGVGGSAAVYAATHRNGKRGAIKLLHPELCAQKGIVERFLREGYVGNKIQHPGAVSVLDDDVTEDGMAFLVMELLEGYTLERRLRKTTTVPVREALKMAEDLLDVLAAAHDIGIVHRDVKPANIFVTKQKVLKVLDFGIARLVEDEKLVYGETQMGQPLGTPAFMPPEQARGRWDEVDARTDVWAVGATLWALITGQRPRRADTAKEELMLAMSQPMPPISTLAPQISAEAAKLVDRALSFEKAARWPSARTMQQALRLALLLEQASTSTAPEVGMGVEPVTGSISINPSSVGSSSGHTPGSLPPTGRSSDTTGLRGITPGEGDLGPLSLSRFDALGPRIPRPKTAAQLSLSTTPTGDARLLTTGAATSLETAPLPAPPPPKPRRTAWVVLAVVTIAAGGVAAAHFGGVIDLRALAGQAPPVVSAVPPPPPATSIPALAPAPTGAPTPTVAPTPSVKPTSSASAGPASSASAASSTHAAAASPSEAPSTKAKPAPPSSDTASP